jgi:5,6-dimethylbenzimidazole synthase
VSFYDAPVLTDLMQLPPDIRPVAWLCVGPVREFQKIPDLERFGWRERRPLTEAVHWEHYSPAAPRS